METILNDISMETEVVDWDAQDKKVTLIESFQSMKVKLTFFLIL